MEPACDEAFRGMDIVLGAAENDIAKRFAPAIVKAGAVFVDNSRKAQEIIKDNLTSVGMGKQSQVVADDAAAFLTRTAETYDIIFLDPPYDLGYVPKLMPLLGRCLAPEGIVLFEHRKGEPMPETAGDLRLKKQYFYGKTAVTTYEKASAE